MLLTKNYLLQCLYPLRAVVHSYATGMYMLKHLRLDMHIWTASACPPIPLPIN